MSIIVEMRKAGYGMVVKGMVFAVSLPNSISITSFMTCKLLYSFMR